MLKLHKEMKIQFYWSSLIYSQMLNNLWMLIKKIISYLCKNPTFSISKFSITFLLTNICRAVFYAPEWLWISYAHTTQTTSNAHNIWGRKINTNLS